MLSLSQCGLNRIPVKNLVNAGSTETSTRSFPSDWEAVSGTPFAVPTDIVDRSRRGCYWQHLEFATFPNAAFAAYLQPSLQSGVIEMISNVSSSSLPSSKLDDMAYLEPLSPIRPPWRRYVSYYSGCAKGDSERQKLVYP
jgi:hypothetical protein